MIFGKPHNNTHHLNIYPTLSSSSWAGKKKLGKEKIILKYVTAFTAHIHKKKVFP